MDEILELQRQLAEAQGGSSFSRLSERNCVELVMKLQSLKLVDLIFTRSGKEYLTHNQLIEDIEDEILTRGGRVNIIDLPEALNVDLVHIEAKLPAVLEKTQGEVQLVRGEILSSYYLSSLAEEVQDNITASETGVSSVGDIAMEYNLPVKVIASVLKSQDGHAFSFDEETGILRSAASLKRAHCLSRGALSAVIHPSSLGEIADRLNVPMHIMLETATEMQESGEIDGKIEGPSARAVFVPALFSRAASKSAHDQFLNSGFITFEHLRNVAIVNAKEFCSMADADAVELNSCIVSSSLLHSLMSAISETKLNSSWMDCEAYLPLDFPAEDLELCITHASKQLHVSDDADMPATDSQKKKKLPKSTKRRKPKQSAFSATASKIAAPTVFGGRFIISSVILEAIESAVQAHAAEKAHVLSLEYKGVVESGGVLPWMDSYPVAAEGGRGGDKKEGLGRGKQFSSNRPSLPNPPCIAVPSKEDVHTLLANNSDIREILLTDYMGTTDLHEEVLEVLVNAFFGETELNVLYQSHSREAILQLEKMQADRDHSFEKKLLATLDKIGLFDRTCATLGDKKLIDGSRNHIFESLVYPCVNSILKKLALGVDFSGPGDEIPCSGSHAERVRRVRDAHRQLPSDLGSLVKPLIAGFAVKPSKGFSSFLTGYDKAAGNLNLPRRRPVDKKKEHSLCTANRLDLINRLEKDKLSTQMAFECAVVLLHARCVQGAVVLVPPALFSELSQSLEESADPPEARVALQQLRLSLLRPSAESGSSGAVDWSSPLSSEGEEQLSALRRFIV